jgi:hypothetical protein
MTEERFTVTNHEFDLLFEKLKNWGRWGEDDDRGTLNFIGEKEVEVAVLGGDGDSDARPSPVEGVGGPIHVLSIAALGMCLLDNLDLETLSEACAEAGRFEFLLIVAPLIVPGGTGSPVNPIAVL